MHPEAARLIDALELKEHPEGGWYRETWRAAARVDGPAGERAAGTSILYLLAGGAVSRLHRLKGDEVWHLHAGGPLDLHLLEPRGARVLRLDSAAPAYQAVVPGGTWFGAETAHPEGWALVGCAMAPGFDFADFELGRRAHLAAAYPRSADLILRLTSEEDHS